MLTPGMEPRDELNRIIRASAGVLVVLGYEDCTKRMCLGSFEVDVEFSTTRLHELRKTDGVAIINPERQRIRWANIQLLPGPSIPTTGSGIRRRTVHRVAVQTGSPVITVSHFLRVTSPYLDDRRYALDDPETPLSRTSLVIATLEEYRNRLDEASGFLATLEIDDMVMAYDVSLVVQHQEMVHRVRHEISDQLIQLGEHGHLFKVQQSESMRGFAVNHSLLIRDYISQDFSEEKVVDRLGGPNDAKLPDLGLVARIIGVSGIGSETLETPLLPRELRMLARIPRLPVHIVEATSRHQGALSELLEASTEELQEIDGVGPQRTQIIHDGLERLVKNSAFNRMH